MKGGNNVVKTDDILEAFQDTGRLIAKEKANSFGEVISSFTQSTRLTNDVEFWRWMGANYPKNLSSTALIQQTVRNNGQWLSTQIQGKGYEWDYMSSQRLRPSKIFSRFDAGNCPTQPGIDITETNILNKSIKQTYQNKAYVSANHPDLHNTPKNAVVVTNKEKVGYAKEQGYTTEQFKTSKEIIETRDARYEQAVKGKANTSYNLKNITSASIKAGIVGTVIGMTAETVCLYQSWKEGEISDKKYVTEILKSGGDAGVTAGATTAVMIPVQAAITSAGMSTLIGMPIAFVLSNTINKIVGPCFARGEYGRILGEAKFYYELEDAYREFVYVAEQAANQYIGFVKQIERQSRQFNMMRSTSRQLDMDLKNLYDSI